MNIEKITYKLVKDTLENGTISPFIVKMLISYLTDEQRGAVLDEIVNERQSLLFKKGDEVWIDPKDNKYDLKDCYEDDMMKDAIMMDEHGFIKGEIISDTNYRNECSPYATEYKIIVKFHTLRTGATLDMDTNMANKEIRVKRSNIMGLWRPLE